MYDKHLFKIIMYLYSFWPIHRESECVTEAIFLDVKVHPQNMKHVYTQNNKHNSDLITLFLPKRTRD